MRHEDLYIAGVGSWYPKPVTADEAIEAGLWDEAGRRRTGQVSAAVAGDDDTQPEMAVRAGKLAVRQSGHAESDFGVLMHAAAGFNGLDGWNITSYLQHEILAGHGLSMEVRQQSNGAMVAIELAAAYLAAGTDRTAALITASDRFVLPVWDRWRAYAGLVLGDGASAAVLSRRSGFARVLSVVTRSRPELERAQRADLPFKPYADPHDTDLYPISLIRRMQDYAAASGMGMSGVFRRMNETLVETVNTAAEEAGTRLADVEHLIFPSFGRQMMQQEVLGPLGIDKERTPWQWVAEVGHVGATDQFGALDHLGRAGLLQPGQRVMMTGIGLGFNWTTAVIEILEPPVTVESAL
ncbi:ketoacyl-ACP synthase III family protein [Streptomyces sp. NPDC015127]|uniref:ketoacyl-ACP synthase III family protein n=1 Tax=Streptomyces sp. NPDC015127 TaxID=3364939 RepID=UPI0036F69327